MRKLPYALLEQKVIPWDEEECPIEMVEGVQSLEEISTLWEDWNGEDIIYFDLETRGTKPHWGDAGCKVMCAAFADSRGCLSIDFTSSYPSLWNDIVHHLWKLNIPLGVYNVSFEGSVMLKDNPNTHLTWKERWPNIVECTFSLFRYLSTEGWENQRWGLKESQVNLLGWDEKGDVEVDDWLIDNGYFKTVKGIDRATKAEMWRVPFQILGHYCALDAISTRMLSQHIIQPARDRFAIFTAGRLQAVHLYECMLLCVQQMEGMHVDKERLQAYYDSCMAEGLNNLKKFGQLPQVQIFLEVKREREWNELLAAKPTQSHKKLPVLGNEPLKVTKAGNISKTWIKWNEKREALAVMEPEETHHFKLWTQKCKDFEQRPMYSFFNPNSTPDKQELLFDCLGFEVLELTKSGNPSTGKAVLRAYGDVGMGLLDCIRPCKIATYARAWGLSSEVDGYLHLQMKPVGCVTTRLSGGQENG